MNAREKMVYEIKHKYGLATPSILSVLLQIPREAFTPIHVRHHAYRDGPVPIGYGQTMSQPYTVALMTDLLDLSDEDRVLEVGTGSGYQAAVLSRLANKVYTIEIVESLAEKAAKRLKKLGYKNVYIKAGSGEYGWKENAPYDAILVTAGLEKEVPKVLFEQLKFGGVLVAPVGQGSDKVMTRYTKKSKTKIEKEEFGIFHFVPFIKKERHR